MREMRATYLTEHVLQQLRMMNVGSWCFRCYPISLSEWGNIYADLFFGVFILCSHDTKICLIIFLHLSFVLCVDLSLFVSGSVSFSVSSCQFALFCAYCCL